MSTVQDIFKTHPHPAQMDIDLLSRAAQEVFACSQTCTACSDDCLGEDDAMALRRCIRVCLDCADICDTTGRVLSRQTESNLTMVQNQIDACAAACGLCAEECERWAAHHEHCRACAEICRSCESTCKDLRDKMAA